MPNMIPTTSEFIETYPQFSGNSYAQSIDRNISLSAKLLAKDVWGELYSEGIMLDVAHTLFLDIQAQKQNGMGAMQMAVGTISSVSAAGVSTSFNGASGNKSITEDYYSKTIYGQQFLRLRRLVAPLGLLTA